MDGVTERDNGRSANGTGDGLRVLAANEDRAALEELAGVLRGLGHHVSAIAVDVDEAARQIADEDPDVAMVKVAGDDEHALALITEIDEYASGPVIALLEVEDPGFVAAAAEKGIFAYVRPVAPETVQGAIEVAVRRHAEAQELSEQVDQLSTALERRAIIERAKGILMERHGVGEREAFELVRDHARGTNTKVVDVARSVSDGHPLLPKR